MRRLACSTGLMIAAVVAPTQAPASSSATTRLVAIVPPSCTLQVVGDSVSDHRALLTIKRTCNTGHVLTFRSADTAGLGHVTLHYNGAVVDLSTSYAALPQPERYYDGYDQIEIDASAGSVEDLERFASSLGVGVDIA